MMIGCSTSTFFVFALLASLQGFAIGYPSYGDGNEVEIEYHPVDVESASSRNGRLLYSNPDELTSKYWIEQAQKTVLEKATQKLNTNVAKNIIMFLGDGMSVPTYAATRAYLGGEEQQLAFDKFPHTALSKTYCVDKQVADSACSATAYLGGVKANYGTIGVTATVDRYSCETMADSDNHVSSIGRWMQLKGSKVGIITTTRVTDASPGGVYAHTAERGWESDTDVINAGANVTSCPDTAQQLVYNEIGSDIYVVLGGGRRVFIPKESFDEDGEAGKRSDGRNLTQEWLDVKNNKNVVAEYVSNRDQLLSVSDETEALIGFFGANDMPYNIERDASYTPSLEEMTEVAIEVLTRNNDNGYFLFVEGARIDHAHHGSRGRAAVDETVEFSKAIQKAVDMTSEEDTLIVVTSDHAHTMSVSGYPVRHNNILGVAGKDDEGYDYLTLNYANGPGYRASFENGTRYNVSSDDTTGLTYKFPSVYPLGSETHGGDDVGIFARGPWAHLYAGVIEQSVIPHIMAYASCSGTGPTACDGKDNGGTSITGSMSIFLVGIISLILCRI